MTKSKPSYSLHEMKSNPNNITIRVEQVDLNRFGAPTGSSRVGFTASFPKPEDGGQAILDALENGEFAYELGARTTSQNGQILYEVSEVTADVKNEVESEA